MKMALVVKERSPDLRTQVGAVIVDKDKRIVSTGYNGTPAGFDDSFIDWFDKSKHPYIIHAEANAIAYARRSLKGCTIYVTLSPCPECAKMIVQHKIKRVVFANHRDANNFSLDFFKQCGVDYELLPSDILDLKIKE